MISFLFDPLLATSYSDEVPLNDNSTLDAASSVLLVGPKHQPSVPITKFDYRPTSNVPSSFDPFDEDAEVAEISQALISWNDDDDHELTHYASPILECVDTFSPAAVDLLTLTPTHVGASSSRLRRYPLPELDNRIPGHTKLPVKMSPTSLTSLELIAIDPPSEPSLLAPDDRTIDRSLTLNVSIAPYYDSTRSFEPNLLDESICLSLPNSSFCNEEDDNDCTVQLDGPDESFIQETPRPPTRFSNHPTSAYPDSPGSPTSPCNFNKADDTLMLDAGPDFTLLFDDEDKYLDDLLVDMRIPGKASLWQDESFASSPSTNQPRDKESYCQYPLKMAGKMISLVIPRTIFKLLSGCNVRSDQADYHVALSRVDVDLAPTDDVVDVDSSSVPNKPGSEDVDVSAAGWQDDILLPRKIGSESACITRLKSSSAVSSNHNSCHDSLRLPLSRGISLRDTFRPTTAISAAPIRDLTAPLSKPSSVEPLRATKISSSPSSSNLSQMRNGTYNNQSSSSGAMRFNRATSHDCSKSIRPRSQSISSLNRIIPVSTLDLANRPVPLEPSRASLQPCLRQNIDPSIDDKSRPHRSIRSSPSFSSIPNKSEASSASSISLCVAQPFSVIQPGRLIPSGPSTLR